MNYGKLDKEIGTLKLVPVIKLEKSEYALPLVDALRDGGLPVAEITFRTASAAKSIELVRNKRPEILVGAGTVLTVDQVKQAVDSGAMFLVSPGFNTKVVDFCVSHNLPIFPGVTTPTEVELGREFGLKTLKFFPAEASGGIEKLKAMGAVYDIQFLPTGGISENNLLSYLKLSNVLACGGSWMVQSNLIAAEKFNEIKTIVERAVALVRSV
ncbi:MAG: bifunctional 4-hydroxy-2-oxoglutarate aldolase/2-dehydro-3-deoxy-phosphogluconate aldolase [Sphaerochaeta sp.]|jgi:2-dehydro-3-deoxyphosphogluconate aldolase/(4S)-4-hydroxy-2-oxoglutarate aldolase